LFALSALDLILQPFTRKQLLADFGTEDAYGYRILMSYFKIY